MESVDAFIEVPFEGGNGSVLSVSVPTSVLNPRALIHCQEVFPPRDEKPPEAKLSDPHLFIIFLELFSSQDLSGEESVWNAWVSFSGIFIPVYTHMNTPPYTYTCEL